MRMYTNTIYIMVLIISAMRTESHSILSI